MSVFLIFLFLFYLVPVMQEIPSGAGAKMTIKSSLQEDQKYKKQVSLLQKDVQRLSRKFSSYTSGLSYIVINTTDNRFFLYRNKKLIREGFCSSGSYTMLKTEGEQKWIFKTPKGKYRIQGKITSPVWRRPDWAFVEEGLPIPSANHPSRWEYGVLGDYALSIGDGYLIHGTLYKRFLGMPVTHGCVRLNDEDLEAIYHTLSSSKATFLKKKLQTNGERKKSDWKKDHPDGCDFCYNCIPGLLRCYVDDGSGKNNGRFKVPVRSSTC
jgi:lipoprotein-anchoring transpeptidase ErfK/SrfK